ncbi:hypothetical protein Tco_0899469 [Tanacetum coccineum]
MASMIPLIIAASFFMVICMHSSNARLLHDIAKSSSAKQHHLSISLKITEKDGGALIEGAQAHARPSTTPFSKGAAKNSSTGNAHNKKINVRVAKEGSEMVESSPFHDHVALLKGKHVKDPENPSLSQDHGKEEFTDLKNDDIVTAERTRVHAQPPMDPFLNGSDKFEPSSSHQVALNEGNES